MITPHSMSRILTLSAHMLREHEDPGKFLAWIATHGPAILPELAAMTHSEHESNGLFRMLGIQIYNHMPLERNSFQLAPIPRPAPNAPCDCGSELKYKRCCKTLEMFKEAPDFGNLLFYSLSSYTNKDLAMLPDTRINTQDLAAVAWELFDAGEDRRLLALLEPWFKPGVELNKRQVPLFDLMADLYFELGNPIKRKRLIERVCQSRYKPLAAEGWMRKASMEMDTNKPADAWRSFSKAQQLDPDSPNLCVLEVTMLWSEQRLEELKKRAQFWLARLQRNRNTPPEVLEIIEICCHDPASLFGQEQA